MRVEDCTSRVQVFVRVRLDRSQQGQSAVQIDEAANAVRVLTTDEAPDRMLSGEVTEARDFVFDQVFPERAAQEHVFAKVGLPILHECLRGFNGTIFAYGQTGSGKTHSLLNRGQEAGLLPRLVENLFDHITNDIASVYTVEAAAMQVYNEQLDDLLHPQHQSGGGHGLVVQNGGLVPDLTWTTCQQPDRLSNVFARARANLIYAETKMNKASSRSHAVFQIRITKRRRFEAADDCSLESNACTCSVLNVIDLAGSERIKKSGVEGVHFKEATSINKSLLALGNVVNALAVKKAHVPFRDSKLTRILERSLGGNCKTALLVCASPATEHAHETISSLDFASRAMCIEVNARVNCIMTFDNKGPSNNEQSNLEAAKSTHALAQEVEILQNGLKEAWTRAEGAEARAASAEQEATTWQQKHDSTAAQLETLQRESRERLSVMEAQRAKERSLAADSMARLREQVDEAQKQINALEVNLVNCKADLEVSSTELVDTKTALEQTRAEAKTCEAALQSKLAAAQAALEVRTAVVDIPAAPLQEECAEVKDVVAVQPEEMSAPGLDATVPLMQAALDATYAASLDSQREEFDARLRTGLESLEYRLAEARKRSEAELARRLALVASREKDERTIADLQEQVDKHLRELQANSREIDELRRRLQKYESGVWTSSKCELTRSLSASGLPMKSGNDVSDGRRRAPVSAHRTKDVHGSLRSLAGEFRKCQSVTMLPAITGSRSRADTPI